MAPCCGRGHEVGCDRKRVGGHNLESGVEPKRRALDLPWGTVSYLEWDGRPRREAPDVLLLHRADGDWLQEAETAGRRVFPSLIGLMATGHAPHTVFPVLVSIPHRADGDREGAGGEGPGRRVPLPHRADGDPGTLGPSRC